MKNRLLLSNCESANQKSKYDIVKILNGKVISIMISDWKKSHLQNTRLDDKEGGKTGSTQHKEITETGDIWLLRNGCYFWVFIYIYGNTFYYTSLSVFLFKTMTVVLLFRPKINCMTIPPVVLVKNCRTIPLCGNFSNHISRTFLIHSSHWFKLNDVMQILRLFHCAS